MTQVQPQMTINPVQVQVNTENGSMQDWSPTALNAVSCVLEYSTCKEIVQDRLEEQHYFAKLPK